jgi:hypothetical protein
LFLKRRYTAMQGTLALRYNATGAGDMSSSPDLAITA